MEKHTHFLATLFVAFTLNQPAFAGADVTIEDIDPATENTASEEAESAKDTAILANYEGNLLNIQERLAVLGYYPTYLVNGTNVDLTKQAVMRFQKDYGLTADGMFGPDTATTLNYYTGTQHIVPIPHYKTVYYYALPSFYAN